MECAVYYNISIPDTTNKAWLQIIASFRIAFFFVPKNAVEENVHYWTDDRCKGPANNGRLS